MVGTPQQPQQQQQQHISSTPCGNTKEKKKSSIRSQKEILELTVVFQRCEDLSDSDAAAFLLLQQTVQDLGGNERFHGFLVQSCCFHPRQEYNRK